MVARVKLNVGRQRLTRNVSPFEAGYVQGIRSQMNNIVRNYEKLLKHIGDVSDDILLEAFQPTFALSQKYVPVDTGRLKDSGFLRKRSGVKPGIEMGYGEGGNPPYAAFVHERTDIPHASPTRSKFLLAALEEDEQNIQRRIVEGYKRAAGIT